MLRSSSRVCLQEHRWASGETALGWSGYDSCIELSIGVCDVERPSMTAFLMAKERVEASNQPANLT